MPETIAKIQEREVSPALQNLIDRANATFGKAKEIVLDAYNQALADGFTPQEAKELLLDKITVFKKRTLYKYIPGEAKSVTRPKKIATLQSPHPPKPQEQERSNEDEPSRVERLPDAPSAVEQWQQQAAEQNELEELRKLAVELKKPFAVETTLEIRGQTIPVVVEVVPSKKVVTISVDEVKARKLAV